MKKLFDSPVFALLLAAVVMFGTMLISTKVDFGKKCRRLTEHFYAGSDNTGAVAADLRTLCQSAEQLAGIGQQLGLDEAEKTLQAADEMRNLLYVQTQNLNSVNAVYHDLLTSTFALEQALARAELSDAQKETVAAAQSSAAAAKASIDASDFNDSARAFLRRYQKFPTVGLAGMVGVNMPCVFNG